MRLPAVRLPAWRPSFDWAEGLGNRRLLLYGVYTAVLFVIFLFANFPHGLLVQRFLRSVDLPGMRLDVGDARFAWWHGFELQRVRLAPTDPSQPAFLEAASLYVRPGLSGLLHGKIDSVQVNGPMYGGEVEGSYATSDGVRRVTLTVDGVQLQRYPLLSSLVQDGQVSGVLSGAMTVESHADPSDTRAAGDLTLQHASVVDAKVNNFPIPGLHFDKAVAKFSLQGTRLEVQDIDAAGPELKLSASGQVALRQPVTDSALNLKVSIGPGADAPDQVKTLLSLIPPPPKGSKPDAPRVLSGTLAKPRLR
jgi:type II secretion system protein N